MRAETLAGVESALQTLTYVLPGRFADAEVVAECVRSSLALLRLLAPGESKGDGTIGRDISSARLRAYTALVRRTSPLAGAVLTALEVCRAVQVPVELLAARLLALPGRLRGLAVYELAKAAARLYVLWRGGFRPVLRSYAAAGAEPTGGDDVLGRIAPSTSKDADVLGDAAVDAYVLAPELAVRPLHGRMARAREVARIMRPAVYVLGLAAASTACARRGTRLRWLAWALAAALDVFAEWETVQGAVRASMPRLAWLSSPGAEDKERLLPANETGAVPPLEADDRTMRAAALILHALRIPLYAQATGPCVSGLAALLDAIVVTRPLASTLRSYGRLVRDSVLYTLDS